MEMISQYTNEIWYGGVIGIMLIVILLGFIGISKENSSKHPQKEDADRINLGIGF